MSWQVVKRRIGRAGSEKQRAARQREWDRKYGRHRRPHPGTGRPPEAAPPPAGQRYSLGQEIGHSGMGLVYRATDASGAPCGPCQEMATHPNTLWGNRFRCAGGGTRTLTGLTAPRILSPMRLPFRHSSPLVRV